MSSSTSASLPIAPATAKTLKFWLIILTMCTCLFVSALEVSSVSTALPTIVNAFNASQFAWVGSAYSLASSAFIPMSGGLAQLFGRRPATLMAICSFALGSALCGRASSMNMLIVGRVFQGLGGGGVQSLSGIILADLVTLKERGFYVGLYGLTWSLAASIGPLIGGRLATVGQWRWIFYLNLPICLVACPLVIIILDLPTPPGNYQSKLMRMDWIGIFLVIGSTVAYTIGLTWGGITVPWSSATVLVPLVVGLVGLVAFIAYDATLAAHPLVPFSILSNLESLSGYFQLFCSAVTTSAIIYYLPVYFQACKLASPVQSGIYMLSFASLAPAVVVAGISIRLSGRYRVQSWIGWVLAIVGIVLSSTIRATDSIGRSVAYWVIAGIGIGALNATPLYPIQAPLPVEQNAPAVAFLWFIRSFASVWGITIGSTVLQNELAKKLPASFVESIPQGTAIVYALIPELSTLPPETLSEVQAAFASSLAVLWRILAVICGVGFLVSWAMKGLPLHNTLDADWTLKDEKGSADVTCDVSVA